MKKFEIEGLVDDVTSDQILSATPTAATLRHAKKRLARLAGIVSKIKEEKIRNEQETAQSDDEKIP